MSADREALQEIERLLASAKSQPTIVQVDEDLDAALARVRALLAEPPVPDGLDCNDLRRQLGLGPTAALEQPDAGS